MNHNSDFSEDFFDFLEVSPRELACERLLFNTTEDILLAMEDSGISQSDLAKKLGKSKSYVCQLLDGTRNMTLKTLSDISCALGAVAKVVITKNGVDVSHQIIPDIPKKQYVTNYSDITFEPKSSFKIAITMPNMDYLQNVVTRP